MAKSGVAMNDGSYPIKNTDDIQNAVRRLGQGNKSDTAIKRHIRKRAKALGVSDAWLKEHVPSVMGG
jgi:hypothetical protein